MVFTWSPQLICWCGWAHSAWPRVFLAKHNWALVVRGTTRWTTGLCPALCCVSSLVQKKQGEKGDCCLYLPRSFSLQNFAVGRGELMDPRLRCRNTSWNQWNNNRANLSGNNLRQANQLLILRKWRWLHWLKLINCRKSIKVCCPAQWATKVLRDAFGKNCGCQSWPKRSTCLDLNSKFVCFIAFFPLSVCLSLSLSRN